MKIYMSMPTGFIRDSFMTEENIRMLESLGDVTWNESDEKLTPEVLADALVDVDVCVCGWGCPQLTEEVLAKANKLKLVAYTAGSVANVVSDAMYERGIRIVCGNEVFARTVAEGTVAHMMFMLRRFTEYEIRNILPTHWKPLDFKTESLYDQTIGIVGYGAISRYMIQMLKPFNAKIKLFSKHTTEEQAAAIGVQKASLEEIFSTCRVISLNTAKNPENHHMINDALLSLMQDGAVLVNTARGDLIDEMALAEHLKTGRIRASLDVYEREPLRAGHPFWNIPKEVLHLQPHLGGPTMDQRPAAARIVFEDILRFQNGEPLENEITSSRSKTMTK